MRRYFSVERYRQRVVVASSAVRKKGERQMDDARASPGVDLWACLM